MSAPLVPSSRLLRLVRTRTFDAAAAGRALVERQHARAITCTRGCSHCCHVKLVVGAGTGVLIALHLIETKQLTASLVERLRDSDRLQTRVSHAQHFAEGHACVFLDRSGACSIHPVRPVHCALAFSFTDDPRRCGQVGNQELEFVRSPDLVNAVSDVSDAVLEVLGVGENAAMTLPGAVLWGAALLRGEEDPGVFRMDAQVFAQEDRRVADVFDEASVAFAARTP